MSHKNKQNTPLTLDKMILWGRGKSEMSDTLRSKRVKTVLNDSRKVEKGDVFIALRTENDDGHRYVQSAFEKGALSAIVDKKGAKNIPEKFLKKCIVVSDTLKAVQSMAAKYRKEMGIFIVGITGSNGKTTTRSFISSVLKQVVKVGETYTNWNNHIGVPMSLLRFDGDEWAGVIEMGANHVGEISPLSRIAAPDVAVITNIGYAHVGLFGSLAATTRAKFEIADGLNKDGYMLVNGDDARLAKGTVERGLRTVRFGMGPKCDIRAENVVVSPDKGLSFTVDGMQYALGMPGRHFIYCVLPAIYIARSCRIPDDLIHEAISALKPVSLRGLVEERRGSRFIVDCYNANPTSMSSAIRYLTDITPRKSERVAVIGDMLELGRYTKDLHVKLGEELAGAGVSKIIAVGEFSSFVAEGASKAGVSVSRIHTATDSEEALKVAMKTIREGETVLLKGSRGVKLERVFEGFGNE